MPPKKKVGRPPNAEPTVTFELGIPQRLALYLDDLILLQGFGGSRQGIIRNFVWNEVNRLIEAERLDQRFGEPRRDYTSKPGG